MVAVKCNIKHLLAAVIQLVCLCVSRQCYQMLLLIMSWSFVGDSLVRRTPLLVTSLWARCSGPLAVLVIVIDSLLNNYLSGVVVTSNTLGYLI